MCFYVYFTVERYEGRVRWGMALMGCYRSAPWYCTTFMNGEPVAHLAILLGSPVRQFCSLQQQCPHQPLPLLQDRGITLINDSHGSSGHSFLLCPHVSSSPFI